MVQPKIWNLDLVTVSQSLFEDTILIPDTIAPGWDLESGQRINEASGQSSKTTITKSCIVFLLVELLQIIAHVHQCILERSLQIGVNERVLESSSHKELERQVIDSLAILSLVILLCIVPGLKESISDSVGSSLIGSKIIEIESGSSQRILNMVHDLPLDGSPVSTEVRAHELPHLVSALLRAVIFELRLQKKEQNIRYTGRQFQIL